MPRGDGTGPMGMGPRTGRAAGYCGGFGMPGCANPIAGRGFGFGRGWGRGFAGRGPGGGRGFRHRYFATGLPGWMRSSGWWAPYRAPGAEAEKQWLEAQAEALRGELDGVKKRLEEFERAGAED